ncbi:MAG: TraB/GumN family protein [Crocinitomicaceae bacterium]
MIFRTCVLILSLVLFLGATNGCQNQFKPEIVSHNNSLLWQISKKGSPTSYMYGTMHMINKEYYNLSDNLKSIINSSETVIMELGGMPNPIQAMLLMTNKSGSLKDLFSPDEWQVILDFYKKEFNMGENQFIRTYNSFKPFFLFQSLTQAYFEADAESYDMNIMQIAKEQNKSLVGLETIAQQIRFFDTIPDSEMAKLILESIKNYEQDKIDFSKLEQLYSAEKIDELIPLMKEQSPEFLKYEDIFLTNRNKVWIPKLKSLLSEKTCFVAVGAAHLYNNEGLISLLKQEGYTLVPLKK